MSRAAVARQQSQMDRLPNPNRSLLGGAARHRPLPAVGLPVKREDRRRWALLSALLHALLIALLITPLATHEGVVIERPQGAGGPGPAGGGGGGHRGTGGVRERVHYVQVAPPAPKPQAAVVPPPPVIKPKPQPIPPPVIKPPEIIPEARPNVKVEAAKPAPAEVSAPVVGTGGGTGRDGSAGSGPGTGGGFGSGTGTGRGSGNGPGTGGGTQANFPPSPTEMFIPPQPMPDKVRGDSVIAEFDVDSTGKVLTFTFTPTREGSYNKRLEDVFKGYRFRPGTTPAGTPIRMKAQIIFRF
jgi:periplasmic protein TonB